MNPQGEPQLIDFRRPRRLAAFAERAVAEWHGRLATLVTENWSRHIPGAATFRHVGSEPMLVREALQSVADPGWGCVLNIGPMAFPTLFAFPNKLVLALVNALIGAQEDEWPAERPLTPVEDSLIQLFVTELARGMADSWPGQDVLTVETGAAVKRPRRTRLFAPRAPVLLTTFSVEQPAGTIECRWIVPEEELADLAAACEDDPAFEKQRTAADTLERVARQMPVELVVQLGRAVLTMSQLSSLVEGDVLVLSQSTTEPLTAVIGDREKFHGWAGRVGIRQAFQISDTQTSQCD